MHITRKLSLQTLFLLVLATAACSEDTSRAPDPALDAGFYDAFPNDLPKDAQQASEPIDAGEEEDFLDLRDTEDTPDPGEDTSPPEEPEPSCEPSGKEICDGLDNDCDGLVDEGPELQESLNNDEEHCGACFQACQFTGARGGSCHEGQCIFEACETGFLDMDGLGNNGCEIRVGPPEVSFLKPSTPKRVVYFEPWYVVLDGETVWLHLAGSHELVDHMVLPGALDAAYDADRGLLVIAGNESVTVLEVTDTGFRRKGWLEARNRELVRVLLKGPYAYFANNFNNARDSRMWVVDLSNPDAPELIRQEATLRGTTDIALLDENHMVTVSASLGLSVYDLSIPERPRLISFAEYEVFPSSALALDRDRGLAFVASTRGGVHIFDISDPQNVARIQIIQDAGSSGQSVQSLWVDGNNLWATDLNSLRRYDVSDLNFPRRRAFQQISGIGQLVLAGDRLMATRFRAWSQNVRPYNINGGSLHEISLHDFGGDLSVPYYDGEAQNPATEILPLGDDTLLFVDSSRQIQLYQRAEDGLWDLDAPTWQAYLGWYTGKLHQGKLHAIVSSPQQPWVQSDYVVYDLVESTDGPSLQEEQRFTFPCNQSGIIPYDFTLSGDLAHVICGSYNARSVHSLDLSDPENPQYLGALESLLPVYHIVATPTQLVVGHERRVLRRVASQMAGYRLPRTSLENPNWTWGPGGVPKHVSEQGQFLHLKLNTGELKLLDIGFRDGYQEADLLEPPAPLASLGEGAKTSGHVTLIPTLEGPAVYSTFSLEGAEVRAPWWRGHLTEEPLFPRSVALAGNTLFVLGARRLLRFPLFDAAAPEP